MDYSINGPELDYDFDRERWKKPLFVIGEPHQEYRQIRDDAWECGDPSLIDKAGSYFQRLFKYQRREQAKRRQWELKHYGHWETPFLYCYPINNWFQEGYKLKTFDDVEAHPFFGLYMTHLPVFNNSRKKTRYFEDVQTLKVFTIKPGEKVIYNKYIYLQQH